MTQTPADTPRQKLVTIRTSATGHILAQGPLIREFEAVIAGKTLRCAEVSIGGDQTRCGPLI